MKRRQRTPPPFNVKYTSVSTDGSLDQVLTIRNNTEVSVLPTLRFVAYDVYGRELPHVVTQGVNGSHRGGPVLPAGGTLTDVLRFDGQGAHLVRGVRVELAAVEEVDHPALEQDVKSVMIDLEQKATADPAEFWGIGLVNPNPFGVTMRISLIELEDRVRDHPRQVRDVVTLQEDVDMASMSNDVIWLPEDVRGQFHEVVHHLRMPTYA
ncbi:hypothetical protein GEV29_16265 [Aeromicrobium sp. SMF47]|uniref:Uncharacterized protein n=1 Tax=Aeromicrobium yanjiei TaxID=2662028 RepID=A0A5Q2MLI1_9ACTN|nr:MULTISPECIES: hypothetical protein [Aeromicrobium]MRJ78093.1 hypothetical protein [Aeromicrobium yanjiei]MRK03276.1 hypothetical protein [Aeromicrobium sp. S22]QGG40830.1 hypothetical protein GEV26_05350 [Aeromicrobium yanjiei]